MRESVRCRNITSDGLQATLGLNVFQEQSGLTTRCHNSLSKSQHQQLCLGIVFARCRFHLLEVADGDYFR
jgi:hypothetical protein